MAAGRRWKTARRRLVALSAAVTTVLAGAGTAWADDIRGSDVSGWQHPSGAALDWAKVRGAGESFTFVKATEGVGFVSKSFALDWRASKAAGLLRGAYHFARPSVGSAVAQADHFVATVGGLNSPGDLPPVLDLEVNGGLTAAQLAAWTGQWLTEVQARSGRTPIIYTSPNFWATSMKNSTAFLGYPLWVARYAATPSSLVWPRWTFWQYTEAGKLPGVTGPVDRNVFNGGLDQLRAMANLPTASAPRAAARPVNGTTAPTGGLARAVPAVLPASAPRTVASAGRLEAFARSATGALLQRTRGANGRWTAWRSLGGRFVGNPAVTSPSAGVLVVVARGADRRLWTRRYAGGRWGAFTRTSTSLTGDPAVATTGGQLTLVARTGGGGLATATLAGARPGRWTALAGPRTGTPTLTARGNRLTLVVRDARGRSHRRIRTAGRWAGWQRTAR